MRFWRSMGLLALAIGHFLAARPAGAQDKQTTTPAPATAVPDTSKAKAAVVKPKAAKTPQSRIPARRAWMIGFSYGYGSANFIGAGKDAFAPMPPTGFSTNSREASTLTQERFAAVFTPKFAFGFEHTDWSKKINGDQWKLSATNAMLTWFPHASGWYLRGGVGVASAHDKHFPDPTSNANIKYADDGFAIQGGAGYEYRIWKRFSLAIQGDYLYGALGKNTAFNVPLGSVGFNWWL